jgi:hypothetical protein
MKLKHLLSAIAFLFFASAISAQVTTATILGKITDTNKEELIGANILATHLPTGINFGTSTRVDGRYTLPNLRIGGPYTIEISYTGYETQKVEGIYLSLAQKLQLDMVLSTDAVMLDGATVTADRNSILNNERTGAETNISTEVLESLPTISRSAADFTRLTPSADGNSFGGRNDQFNNFSLDGSIFNNPFGLDAATAGGQSGAQPVSLDAIEQINVSLAPYDVTQAGFTGAAVNAVTKSGTNEFKGSVFGFFRNQDMVGTKVNDTEVVKADLDQLQFGASLGGPIIKNKLFFFANFEIDNRTDLGTTFVPTNGSNTGENVSRVEEQDLMNISNALKDRFGYETGAYEGYLHDTESTKGLFKLDFAINQNHTLTATYNFLTAFKDKTAHPSAIGRRGPDLTTLQFANSGYRINNNIQSAIVEFRSIFGNKASNKFQAGFTSFDDTRDAASAPFPTLNINRDGSRYIIAGHEPFSINNKLNQQVLQISNNFNIYAGDHTFTIGASLEKFDFDNSFNLGTYAGVFGPEFSSPEAFLDSLDAGVIDPWVTGAEETFAANGGADGELGEGWALAETNVGQLAAYIQDEWAVNPKLTLTAGIRMDMPLYFDTAEKIQENIDRACCYDPTIEYFDEDGNSVIFDHLDLPSQTPLISPRIGFNYDIRGDQTAQLRGGTGLFTGRLPFVWIGNQVANPNFFFYNKTANDFKFPQVWRSNLGYDQKVGEGWIVSLDAIYTKDLNAAYVRNFSLKPPTATLDAPGDNRPVYAFEDHAQLFGGPIFGSGYVFGNTNLGYSFNFTAKVEKRFDNGLFFMLGYNFLDAQDASSIDAEISSDAFERNPAYGNVNKASLAPSLYGNKHRIVGSAYKKFSYGTDNKFATTISTFFSYANAGTTASDFTADFRSSYTYSGDINGDGSGLNDLMYIPTSAEVNEMRFEDNSNATAGEQARALEDYIAQDEYMSDNRGSVAERYALIAPWYGSWDVRVLQDLNFKVGEKTNTIQLSIDVLNFGNLLSSSFNVKELPVNTQPIGVLGVDENGIPTYAFDTSLKNTFSPDFSLDSRWQARVGLRYIF